MRKSRILLVFGVLFLAIGFASVSATLIFTGNVTVGTNQDDFRVEFSKAEVDDEDSVVEINNDKRNINFYTRELTKVNDEVTLEYEISNYSRNYNVRTDVTITGITEGQNEYFYVTTTKDWVTNNEGVIEAGTRTTGSINIKLTKQYDGSTAMEPIEFALTIVTSGVERTELGSELFDTSTPGL